MAPEIGQRRELYTELRFFRRVAASSNNRINSDWQIRCAPLPAGYAERSPGRASRARGNDGAHFVRALSFGAREARLGTRHCT